MKNLLPTSNNWEQSLKSLSEEDLSIKEKD